MLVVRVPTKWVRDAETRGLDIGTIEKRGVSCMLRGTREQIEEALSDASFYATAECGEGKDMDASYRPLVRSAARAVRRLRAALESV